MSELDDSFAKLLGRQPTDRERQELYRVKDALGLKNNDALWLVLMALQHYQDQYEQFPKAIAQAAQEILLDFKVTADVMVQASAEAAKADMAKTVAEIGQKVADSTAHKQRAQWIAVCATVIALTFGGGFWYAYSTGGSAGYSLGYGTGYNEAKDEKAAAAWANTPEGRKAYQLAKAGSISKLAGCDQPGWYIDNGACYVKPTTDGQIYGWKLP